MFSRRSLFRAGVAGLVVADVLYAAKVGMPDYEISASDAIEIERAANEILPHITASRSTFVTEEGKRYEAYPGRRNFSKILANLAYLDGGAEELSRVTDFVRERKVKLSINNFKSAPASVNPSRSPDDPIKVSFDRDFVKNYHAKLPDSF